MIQLLNDIKDYLNMDINCNIVLFETNDNCPIFGSTLPRYWRENQIPQLIQNKILKHDRPNCILRTYKTVENQFNEDLETISININEDVSSEDLIHTFVHEFIHVLQYQLEFNKEYEIPYREHHSSEIWNQYSRILGLKTINNDFTLIRKPGYTYSLIKKYM